MEINVVAEEGNAVIRLKGRFDFSTHRDFRAAIEQSLQEPYTRKIRVDLGGVDYLDSSALGMLLLLREKLAAVRKEAELTGVTGAVKQVFDIANFARLFRIS